MKNARFLTRLDQHRELAGRSGVNAIVSLPFSVEYELDGVTYRVTVPAGFQHDGASIPWGLRNLVERTGAHLEAAIIHDFCYRYHVLPRKLADELFLLLMEVSGVPAWKRRLIWGGVRVGGWVPYGKYNPDSRYRPEVVTQSPVDCERQNKT